MDGWNGWMDGWGRRSEGEGKEKGRKEGRD